MRQREKKEGNIFVGAIDKPSEERYEMSDSIFIDHRDECMFAPRDRGDCASSYEFAAITVYLWHHCKATGKRVAFSEQYIVDCGVNYGPDGCEGDWSAKILEFVRKRSL